MRNIPRNLIEDKTYCVNYLVFKNEYGVREFLYIVIREDKMSAFQEAVRRGNFDADDYGTVLERGKGEPTESIIAKMKLLYKCDHNSGLSVLDYNPEHG